MQDELDFDTFDDNDLYEGFTADEDDIDKDLAEMMRASSLPNDESADGLDQNDFEDGEDEDDLEELY